MGWEKPRSPVSPLWELGGAWVGWAAWVGEGRWGGRRAACSFTFVCNERRALIVERGPVGCVLRTGVSTKLFCVLGTGCSGRSHAHMHPVASPQRPAFPGGECQRTAMAVIQSTQDVAYISRNTRWLFRKSVWFDISCLLSTRAMRYSGNDSEGTTGSPRRRVAGEEQGCELRGPTDALGSEQQARGPAAPPAALRTADAISALKHTNYNMVQHAKQVQAERCFGGDADVSCPVAVIMLYVNVSARETAVPREWSDADITSIISSATVFGNVRASTHMIVQIHYTGVDDNSGPSPPSALPGRKGGVQPQQNQQQRPQRVALPVGEALAVVITDRAGMAYCYNMPGGHCEDVGSRCVTKLLQMTVNVTPSTFLKVVNYRPRSSYDDNLYALYLTAACAAESTSSAARHPGGARSDLASCRPSARCARPSRIVANLRFLMSLCHTESSSVEAELLLDEKNTLDAFKRLIMDVSG